MSWTQHTIATVFSPFRVEGKGNATITDVIYSRKETAGMIESFTGSKEEYEAVKVSTLHFWCMSLDYCVSYFCNVH